MSIQAPAASSLANFLSALHRAGAAIDSACQNPGDTDAFEEAEDGLVELREAFRLLNTDERAAVTPLAALLSKRLTGAHPGATSPRAAKPAPTPAAPTPVPATSTSAPDDPLAAAFAAATSAPVGGGAQPHITDADLSFSLDFAPAPTKLFSGEPTPDALLAHFGYDAFRDGQRDAVQAALDGRDSLVVMPTGGGKSLCYQLPGIADPEKLCVVVTPLVALMRDQYERMAKDGHPAVMLASGLGEDHNRDALAAIEDRSARMVFCSPERFASHAFANALKSRDIGLFVVDEAHCVSEWGHDFRPDYLRLHKALDALGRPPVMACTATATPQVAAEIAGRLGLRDPLVVQGGFDRPNISFDVVSLDGKGAVGRKHATLQTGLHMAANRPAVVYCGTRKDVEAVTESLQAAGLSAVGYHAGMAPDVRTRAQEAFMTGERDIVVATNAFGMGVDKADVRSVWHWAIPTSVEGYYQEAGRAGRDGQPARAVLLAMRADLGRLIGFNKRRSTSVEHVQGFLARLKTAARRGELVLDPPADDEDRLALAVAERAGALVVEPAAGGKLAVTLIGELNARAAAAFCDAAKDRGWEAFRAVERFSSTHDRCRRKQLLDHFGDKRPPAPTGRCCDVCDPLDWLPAPESLPAPQTPAAKPARKPAAATSGRLPGLEVEGEGPLLEALKAWRQRVAGGRPAYQVAKNQTLLDIAAQKPSTPEELAAISGVGPAFMTKYAREVLALVAAD